MNLAKPPPRRLNVAAWDEDLEEPLHTPLAADLRAVAFSKGRSRQDDLGKVGCAILQTIERYNVPCLAE